MRFLLSTICFLAPVASGAFSGECDKELTKYCKTESKFLGKLSCLSKSMTLLSPSCHETILKFTNEKGPCTLEIIRHCPETKNLAVTGNIRCLIKNQKLLSENCLKDLNAVENQKTMEYQRAWRLITPYCTESFKALCPGSLDESGHVKSHECIVTAFKSGKITNRACLDANDEVMEHLKKTLHAPNEKNPTTQNQ